MRAALPVIAALFWILPRPAAAGALPEDQVKAAFIFNFLLFTNWPGRHAESREPLNLCIAGQDEIAEALHDLDGRRLGPSTVLVSTLKDAHEADACEALYLADSERDQWPQWLSATATRLALTVTDGGEALGGRGGVLEVAVESDRVVFSVDLHSARQRRLSFSSRILSLARPVEAR